jgi:hypothetical protein
MIRIFSRISLACMMAVSLSGLAMAHGRARGGPHSAFQYGSQNGYVDGFQHGREDRQARVGYSFETRDFDDAMRGYEPYMGSRDRYQDGYQNGYRAGYDDGFHARRAQNEEAYNDARNPAYGDDDDSGRADGRRSVGFRVGYQDGLIDGEKDLRHNKDFRPSKHDGYKDGDHGYSHDCGAKKEYKREYREGYMAGYQRGYRSLPGAPNR